MIGFRAAVAAMVLACAAASLRGQTLADIAKKTGEARKGAEPVLVYDERDMNPAAARRDLLSIRLDEELWRQFVRVDSQVRFALRTHPDVLQRLEGLNYVTLRSVERFFQREPVVAAALKSATLDAHIYANIYLAARLALSDHADAQGPVQQENALFLKARARDIAALALPLDAFSLHALRSPAALAAPEPTRSATVLPPGATMMPAAPPVKTGAGGVIDTSVGAQIPDFDFVDFEGRPRQLSHFRGRYLMLDFWGSWCGPCRAEIPHVRDAYARFGSRGFEVLGMDSERSATFEQVRDFLAKNGVKWTFARPESVRGIIDDRFQISSFPRVILLDPDGRVIESRNNALRGENLARTLDRLLPK